MATEILHPQDFLIHHSNHHQHRPSRRPKPKTLKKPASDPNRTRRPASEPIPTPRPSRKPTQDPNPNHKPAKNLIMGQVTILKRGESLDSQKPIIPHRFSDLKKSASLNESDLVGRIGPIPDSDMDLKQIRFKQHSSESDIYAGSAFSQSPSPRSLPLPSFSRKFKSIPFVASVAVNDDSATKDLRRILRLDD